MNNLFILGTLIMLFAFQQKPSSLPSDEKIQDYVKLLTQNAQYDPIGINEILLDFKDADSVSFYEVLNRIEELGPKKNPGFDICLLYLKTVGVNNTISKYETKAKSYLSQMEEIAEQSNDPYLFALSKWFRGIAVFNFDELDISMINCLEAIEIFESIVPPEKLYEIYYFLGDLSFLVHDYDNSILYTSQALKYDPKEDTTQMVFKARYINGIGQSYLKKNMLEHAENHFQMSKLQASDYGSDIWIGINDCFLGQVQLLTGRNSEAKASFISSIQKCANEDNNITAHAESWLGRLYWLEGQYDSAAYYFTVSEDWLELPKLRMKLQSKLFLNDLYLFKSDYYRTLGNQSQGDIYFYKFKSLNDSLNSTSLLSNKNNTLLKLENERAGLALQLSEAEKNSLVFKRNLMVTSIILLSIIAIGYIKVRNNRLKLEATIAITEKEKLAADKEAAVIQLNKLKNSLIERTELLKHFEEKVVELEKNSTLKIDMEKIQNFKILTEADWQEFKQLFERIHPGYLQQLKRGALDITAAEMRLATLIKLQFTAKEMAAIMGVSPDTVYKTRSRLRTRLNLSNEESLEAYIVREV